MASKRTKAEAPQAKFPVKRRKELGVYLSEVREDRYLHISNRSIENVRKSTHVNYYLDRLKALQDSNGEQHLINCVKAMCSNFASFYSTFLPRKRYVNFQHAWFSHIGQYIDGVRREGVPSSNVPSSTRSGRRIKDAGAHCRIEAEQCKNLWQKFVESLACPLSVDHQWIIVSSLAYEVYDLMTDEVKCFKGDKTVTLLSDAEQCLQVRDTQPEDEVIIHRYLGFAINSLVEFKKKKLDQLKGRKNVSSATEQIQEEL